MPNIGGPREAKRRMLASIVHLKLLYAAPVSVSALINNANQKKLFSAQIGAALRIVSMKLASTWRKRFLAMAALKRTLSTLSRETMSRVATAVPLWTMRSTHALSAPGGAWEGRPLVGR